MKQKVITLDEFIIKRQMEFEFASGELSGLLRDLGLASKMVHREVNKAGLVDILGSASDTNVHGEEQKKLDVFADDQFIACLKNSGECAAVASEENDDMIVFEESSDANYVVALDPLDGSSNIDVNVSVGTIFSIYRRLDPDQPISHADFLQPGVNQVAAGYIIYGSSTMLVYTTGHGVNGFTLDPSIGEYCLSHPNIKTPADGTIYSINHGYRWHYSDGVKKYIDHCINSAGLREKPYSMRYIGSMVADIHRNLIKGGIFMYPRSKEKPKGKLRMLYECNPLSFVVEQAGGIALNGRTRIMEMVPTELHETCPIFMGSPVMVEMLRDCVVTHNPAKVTTVS